MSNGRVEDGNRNKLDISAAVVNKKGIIVGLVIFVLVITAIGAVFILTRKKESIQTGLVKNPTNNEVLQPKTSTNSSLDSMKQMIVDKETAEKRAADKKREEEEKNRLVQEKLALQESDIKPGETGNSSSNHEQSFRADSSHESDDNNVPLPKSQRILTGETLVKIDKQDEGASHEKDYLQGNEYADGSASVVLKRRYLLSAGTSLSCILKTKIITSYPAITLCQMARDVYSDDGKTLLVRAGAMLIGEQKKAITQGVARVFVNWTTIKDGNIKVRVDALGTDSLGAAGLPAWIDSHFWERFGNSILLSLIGDAMDSVKNLTQSNSGNQGSITYDNTSDASQQQAAIALQNSINIAPTGYINQGTVISIIVPRNVDFSNVYEVN